MDKPLRDLIEIIHFTEDVSAKIHGLLDEAEIYRTVKEEFAKSKRYTASILLLTDDGSKLGIAGTSIALDKLETAEKTVGIRLKGYSIDLEKSSIYSQVVREGETLQVKVSDIISELFPRPLAYLISKTMGYEKKPSILTPLKRQGNIIGALAVSSTHLAEYFIPSVRNLAQHISIALELADEHAERKQVEEELRKYRDHLRERVEERTAELMEINEQLQREIAGRKRMDEALQGSEEKYRTLVEQSLQGLVVIQDFRIVFANTAFAEISGYTVEELMSLSPQEVRAMVHPEDQSLVWGRLRDRLAGKAMPPRYEYRGIRKDGTVRWLEMFASRIQYGGKPAIQGALIDITERKMAEKALERRATQLAAVNEIGRQIASILDLDELLRQIVNLLEDAFGYRYVYILLLNEDSRELVTRAGAGSGRMLEGTRIAVEARAINTYVARTGKPLLANDVSQEPMYLLMEEAADTKSELTVPIQVKDEVIGTLDVQSTERNAFDESDLFTLQALASQAGIAIENARLYEEARRRIDELTGLHELSQAFSSMTDVRETYGELTKRMAQLIGCQACTIATYDPQTREMQAQPPGYGVPDALVQSFRYKVDGTARNAWNFRLQGPLLANEIVEIPDFFSQWVEGFGLFNLLIVPMTLEGRITGLVYAANKPQGFAEGDSKLLTIFAGRAAVIIENARLYEESRHRLGELSTIQEVSVAATSTMDFDQALERAVDAMQEVLDFQVFGFLLLDEQTGRLYLHPSYRRIDPQVAEKLDLRLGRGITGWVAETGQPLLVPDVSQDPRYLGAVSEIRSEMCVPLKIGERVIGVIDVESDQVNAFSEDDLRLLSTLAGQLATTIENAHLFAETKRNANDLALLLGTSTAISSTLDLDQILETVARQITTSLVATFCRITLLDGTGENLVIRATSPIRRQEAKNGFGRRCPLATVPWHQQVIETAEPVILRQDVPERALSDEERKVALTEGVKSAALIPLIVGGRVLGVISMGEERSWERSPFTQEKVELCQSIAAQAAVAIENARLYEELQQSFLQTIATLAAAVEAKDPYTGGHSQRTTELAAAIAQKLGLSEQEIELIHYASLLHDVGKIGISEQILSKPGPLNEEEWEIIRRHPALGANIVERAAALQKLVPIILHHHEHYDGQGYPDGLKGEGIPLKARILAVADAFEAMTSDRAYRPAMTVEQALATLREGADKQWDGKIVAVLHKIIREQGHIKFGHRSKQAK